MRDRKYLSEYEVGVADAKEECMEEIQQLQHDKEELLEAGQKLVNKVNRVTSNHRHGNLVTANDLDTLSNQQIEFESVLAKHKGE